MEINEMFSIKEIAKRSKYGVCWVKALSCASNHDYERALFFLSKCEEIVGSQYEEVLLLKAFLKLALHDKEAAHGNAVLAISRLSKNKEMSVFDKLYMCAYATDIMNMALDKDRGINSFVDHSKFDLNKVSSHLRKNFPFDVRGIKLLRGEN